MRKGEYRVGSVAAAPGTKATGFLEVPGTTVRMPMTVINGEEPGPTVLITGGVHGGEYPGIEAAMRLADDLQPRDVRGQVALIHIVSPLSFLARQQHVVPQDGKNINRQFPGNALGTVTERMAHTLMTEVLPGLDAWVDLHGGDIHEALIPFTIYSVSAAPEVQERSRRLAEVVGNQYIVARRGSVRGTYGAAGVAGVPCVMIEAGALGQLDPESVQIHLDGCRNVLKELGVLPGAPKPVGPTAVLNTFDSVSAQQEGCWYPYVKVGESVTAGQLVGVVKDYFSHVIGQYYAPTTGVLLVVTTSLAITVGDSLLTIGAE